MCESKQLQAQRIQRLNSKFILVRIRNTDHVLRVRWDQSPLTESMAIMVCCDFEEEGKWAGVMVRYNAWWMRPEATKMPRHCVSLCLIYEVCIHAQIKKSAISDSQLATTPLSQAASAGFWLNFRLSLCFNRPAHVQCALLYTLCVRWCMRWLSCMYLHSQRNQISLSGQ